MHEEKNKHDKKIRIAAMGDLHVQRSSKGNLQDIFREISNEADILLLCGDLTDHGYPEEADILADELRSCTIPIVGVLGNHDYTSKKQEEIKQILSSSSLLTLLYDQPVEKLGIGFAGVKGFGGGFGTNMLALFGEEGMRNFVYEAINEVEDLENQLKQLHTTTKIVLMHYSPIRETVIGEAEEIYPFLGSSRFEEPIDLFNVRAVFHGHAHFGSPHGKTLKGIPVYNASQFVQLKTAKKPYLLIEV